MVRKITIYANTPEEMAKSLCEVLMQFDTTLIRSKFNALTSLNFKSLFSSSNSVKLRYIPDEIGEYIMTVDYGGLRSTINAMDSINSIDIWIECNKRGTVVSWGVETAYI